MTAKALFALPGREITGQVQIGTETFGPDRLGLIRIERGLSNANYFEIGTAFSASLELELIDDLQQVNLEALKGATAAVSFTIAGSAEVVSAGRFILDEPERVGQMKVRVQGFDAMQRADIPYDPDRVAYPATLNDIAVDCCLQAGIPRGWGSFPSGGVVIQTRPQFYEMTARQVLADIAELAGGWAYIDPAGALRIAGMAASDLSVSDENTVKFTRDEQGVQIAGVQIIEQGSDPVQMGAAPFLYVVDNVFVQGDGARFLSPLYGHWSGETLAAGTLEFNGNPAGQVTAAVDVLHMGQSLKTLPMKRTLRYRGGLREIWHCPPLADKPQETRTGLVRNLYKVGARLQVLEDSIESTVTSSVTNYLSDPDVRETLKGDPGTDATKEYVHWMFADNASGGGMSRYPEEKPYIGIGFPRPYPTPSRAPIDYYWNLFRGSANNSGLPARPDKWNWLKFADDSIGNGMSDSIENKKYIGFALLKDTPVKSPDPTMYEWHALYASMVHVGTQPPEFPQEGDTWVDQALTPPQMLVYSGGVWATVNDVTDALLALGGKVDSETMTQLLKDLKDGVLEHVSTKVSQTEEKIEFRFGKAKELIEGVESGANARFDEQTKYIRFEDGIIKLGVVGDPLSIEISNEKISFLHNGMETYYIADGKVYFRHGHFLESLQIETFVFRVTAAGDLVVR